MRGDSVNQLETVNIAFIHPTLVVHLTVIKAKTRPEIEAISSAAS